MKNKQTFKEFLISQKIKEPGWYVVDHIDTPVEGPMQEGAAKRLADTMSKEHAEKYGAGDISAFSAEYFSAEEIQRMNKF